MAGETIVFHKGHGLPYSKGLMAQSLSAIGLSPERSFELARAVERRLGERGAERARRGRPERRVRGGAPGRGGRGRRCGASARWTRLGRLERPLVVMIGGTTGVGKSTLATMLAGRLGVNRVIATDVIRQVLRAFFTEEAMPDRALLGVRGGRARGLSPTRRELVVTGHRGDRGPGDRRGQAGGARGRPRAARGAGRPPPRALRDGGGAARGGGRGAPPGPLLPSRPARGRPSATWPRSRTSAPSRAIWPSAPGPRAWP